VLTSATIAAATPTQKSLPPLPDEAEACVSLAPSSSVLFSFFACSVARQHWAREHRRAGRQ